MITLSGQYPNNIIIIFYSTIYLRLLYSFRDVRPDREIHDEQTQSTQKRLDP
jgi:hypothetical protein